MNIELNYRTTFKCSIILFCLVLYSSCSILKKEKVKTECDTLFSLITIQKEDEELIKNWIYGNSEDCKKLHDFLKKENLSQNAKDFTLFTIYLKIEDDEFRVERLIEFYSLVKNNDDPFNLQGQMEETLRKRNKN